MNTRLCKCIQSARYNMSNNVNNYIVRSYRIVIWLVTAPAIIWQKAENTYLYLQRTQRLRSMCNRNVLAFTAVTQPPQQQSNGCTRILRWKLVGLKCLERYRCPKLAAPNFHMTRLSSNIIKPICHFCSEN